MFGDMSAIDLARFQFAFTISAHIIFPAFSIGSASFLAVLNGVWLWRREEVYLGLFDYWRTIFAVVFGMGVVSGIVMSYQFGMNRPGFAGGWLV
jgi:cytochrome d ubiquinol oxidase subunit I